MKGVTAALINTKGRDALRSRTWLSRPKPSSRGITIPFVFEQFRQKIDNMSLVINNQDERFGPTIHLMLHDIVGKNHSLFSTYTYSNRKATLHRPCEMQVDHRRNIAKTGNPGIGN